MIRALLLAALAALGWHSVRTAARLRRLEQTTGAWRTAAPTPQRPALRAAADDLRRWASSRAGRGTVAGNAALVVLAELDGRPARWPRGPLQVRGHG